MLALGSVPLSCHLQHLQTFLLQSIEKIMIKGLIINFQAFFPHYFIFFMLIISLLLLMLLTLTFRLLTSLINYHSLNLLEYIL